MKQQSTETLSDVTRSNLHRIEEMKIAIQARKPSMRQQSVI